MGRDALSMNKATNQQNRHKATRAFAKQAQLPYPTAALTPGQILADVSAMERS